MWRISSSSWYPPPSSSGLILPPDRRWWFWATYLNWSWLCRTVAADHGGVWWRRPRCLCCSFYSLIMTNGSSLGWQTGTGPPPAGSRLSPLTRFIRCVTELNMWQDLQLYCLLQRVFVIQTTHTMAVNLSKVNSKSWVRSTIKCQFWVLELVSYVK